MSPRVFVLSTTFYKSEHETRFELALETTALAIKQEYRVILVDGSPSPQIGRAFQDIGAKVFRQKESGMGPSRRQAFSLPLVCANTGDIFFWTELEKTDIIRFIPEIIEPIIKGDCDISIPVRTEKSRQTYPKFQWDVEHVANRVYQEITGLLVDSVFGPVGMNYQALPYFASCEPKKLGVADNYIQHIAPMVAFSRGLRILSPGVEVDFEYPPRQREEEEGPLFRQMVEKRLGQIEELVEAFIKLGQDLKPDWCQRQSWSAIPY